MLKPMTRRVAKIVYAFSFSSSSASSTIAFEDQNEDDSEKNSRIRMNILAARNVFHTLAALMAVKAVVTINLAIVFLHVTPF